MPNNDKEINEQVPRGRDNSDASKTGAGSSDREVNRGAERQSDSKDDFTDIGTDAQQADGTAAGPSTS